MERSPGVSSRTAYITLFLRADSRAWIVPHRLLVDHLVAPLGTSGPRAPRLSWWLPTGAHHQEAFVLQAGEWDSGRVDGDRHELVRVRRTAARPHANGSSGGSRCGPIWARATGRTGRRGRWAWPRPATGRRPWISPQEPEPRPPAGERPAHQLRHAFTLDGDPWRARLYATAHGLYELFLNGTRVGDLELTPGTTAYRTHLDVQTYDVTDLLAPRRERARGGAQRRVVAGQDRLHPRGRLLRRRGGPPRPARGPPRGRTVAAPWAAGRAGRPRPARSCGPTSSTASGSTSDTAPTAGPSPASTTRRGRPARVVEHRFDGARAPPPPRRSAGSRSCARAASRRLPSGRHVVDLGQNINGWVRLEDLGPAGTTSTLVHGELLDDSGDVTTEHLRPFEFVSRALLPAGQVDVVVSRGRAGRPLRAPPHHPRLPVRRHRRPPRPARRRGRDRRRRPHRPRADRLVLLQRRPAEPTARGRGVELPRTTPATCPRTARSGSGRGGPVTGSSSARPRPSSTTSPASRPSGCATSAADQWPDGRVPNILPEPHGPATHDNDIAAFMTGSAGWGDAAVIVPWETWVEPTATSTSSPRASTR